MAKKKKTEQPVTSSIVQNWAEQNKQRLSEINTENPALYSGIVQALNYLNQTLGGKGEVAAPEYPQRKFNVGDKVGVSFDSIVRAVVDYEWDSNKNKWIYHLEGDPAVLEYEDKLVLVSNEPTKPQWTLEDFEDRIIKVDNNAEARALQMFLKKLGVKSAKDAKTKELFDLPYQTYNRWYIVLGKNLYGTNNHSTPSTKTIYFKELGIEPINKIISEREFLNTSVFIEKVEESLFLKERLEKGFKIEEYASAIVATLPKVFNIESTKQTNVNGTYTITTSPYLPINFTIQEFGYPYKNTYEKGDRYVWNTKSGTSISADPPYLYRQEANGLLTQVIDENSEGDIFIRYVHPANEGNPIVEWLSNDPVKRSDFDKYVASEDIRILADRPKYEEGTKVGNVNIVAIGFHEKTGKYRYWVDIPSENRMNRFDSEEELDSFIELSGMVDWLEENTSEKTTGELPETNALKVGDKVKLPKTKRGIKIWPNMSVVYDSAIERSQKYLYITEIDGDIYVLDTTESGTGDFYSLKQDKLELFVSPQKVKKSKQPKPKFKVGDYVKEVGKTDLYRISEINWNTKNNEYTYDVQDIADPDWGYVYSEDKIEPMNASKGRPLPKFKQGDTVRYRGATATLTVRAVIWYDYAGVYEYSMNWDEDGEATTEWEDKLESAPKPPISQKTQKPQPKFKVGDKVKYLTRSETYTVEKVKWDVSEEEYEYTLIRDKYRKPIVESEKQLELAAFDDDDLESALEDLEI